MVYTKAPHDFDAKLAAVGCFVEFEGEFVLLERQKHKSEPGAWGIPSGKIDPNDKTPIDAMVRELREETGITVTTADLFALETVFVRYETHDMIYHMFCLYPAERPDIHINHEEHSAFAWSTPEGAYSMKLMIDLAPCIDLTYKT